MIPIGFRPMFGGPSALLSPSPPRHPRLGEEGEEGAAKSLSKTHQNVWEYHSPALPPPLMTSGRVWTGFGAPGEAQSTQNLPKTDPKG